MFEFVQCIGIIILMALPFVGAFALMGRLGADVKRPPRDEHAGNGNGAGIG